MMTLKEAKKLIERRNLFLVKRGWKDPSSEKSIWPDIQKYYEDPKRETLVEGRHVVAIVNLKLNGSTISSGNRDLTPVMTVWTLDSRGVDTFNVLTEKLAYLQAKPTEEEMLYFKKSMQDVKAFISSEKISLQDLIDAQILFSDNTLARLKKESKKSKGTVKHQFEIDRDKYNRIARKFREGNFAICQAIYAIKTGDEEDLYLSEEHADDSSEWRDQWKPEISENEINLLETIIKSNEDTEKMLPILFKHAPNPQLLNIDWSLWGELFFAADDNKSFEEIIKEFSDSYQEDYIQRNKIVYDKL